MIQKRYIDSKTLLSIKTLFCTINYTILHHQKICRRNQTLKSIFRLQNCSPSQFFHHIYHECDVTPTIRFGLSFCEACCVVGLHFCVLMRVCDVRDESLSGFFFNIFKITSKKCDKNSGLNADHVSKIYFITTKQECCSNANQDRSICQLSYKFCWPSTFFFQSMTTPIAL